MHLLEWKKLTAQCISFDWCKPDANRGQLAGDLCCSRNCERMTVTASPNRTPPSRIPVDSLSPAGWWREVSQAIDEIAQELFDGAAHPITSRFSRLANLARATTSACPTFPRGVALLGKSRPV
jgi:hypothetical protein